ERVVGGREDGDVLGRVERVDQVGLTDRGDQRGQRRVVGRRGGDRVLGHALEAAVTFLGNVGTARAEVLARGLRTLGTLVGALVHAALGLLGAAGLGGLVGAAVVHAATGGQAEGECGGRGGGGERVLTDHGVLADHRSLPCRYFSVFALV